MAVPSDDAVDRYVSTGGTVYNYNFKIDDQTHITVSAGGITLALGSQYTVSGVGNSAGGSVTLLTAQAIGVIVVLLRNQPIGHDSTYVRTEVYDPLKVSTDFDKQTMVSQMLREQIGRSPKFARGSAYSEMVFPEPGGDDTVVGWTGGLLRNKTLVTSAGLVIAARSVKDFGARGDGSHDDTSAFINAFASELTVFVPAGNYKLTAGLTTPAVNNFALYGDGWGSRLIMHHASAPIITLAAGQNAHRVESLYLDRDIAATAGGNGINATLTLNYALLRDLRIANQYNGVSLGPTGFSLMQDCICEYNYHDGVQILNTASDGVCQWSLRNVACFQNDLHGFFIASIAGPGQMTLGTFERLTTFANNGFGLSVLGLVAVPIQGFRLQGGFLGADGDNEVSIDSFGDQHVIRDVFVEGSGTIATGRTLATPATNAGNGIAIGTNNVGVSVDGCHSSMNSSNGFTSGATNALFTSNVARNNGIALIANQRNGFLILAGRATLNSNRSGNVVTPAQFDGIRSLVDDVLVVGNDLSNNASAGFNQTVPVVNSVIANNRT
jgi:hypothetical protein